MESRHDASLQMRQFLRIHLRLVRQLLYPLIVVCPLDEDGQVALQHLASLGLRKELGALRRVREGGRRVVELHDREQAVSVLRLGSRFGFG